MFKFIKIKDKDNVYDQVDIEFTVRDSDISKEVLKEFFNDFLRACGYIVSYEEE